MDTKTILAATFVLPLLMLGCDRQQVAPGASASSRDRQTAAAAADRMLEKSPPAAGTPSYSGAPGSAEATSPGTAPPTATQPGEGADDALWGGDRFGTRPR